MADLEEGLLHDAEAPSPKRPRYDAFDEEPVAKQPRLLGLDERDEEGALAEGGLTDDMPNFGNGVDAGADEEDDLFDNDLNDADAYNTDTYKAGLDDKGLEDTGLEGTGPEDTGLEDTVPENTGLVGTGLEGTGLEDDEEDDLFGEHLEDDVEAAPDAEQHAAQQAAPAARADEPPAQARTDELDELHDAEHVEEAEEEVPQEKKKKGEDMQEVFNIVKAFVSKLEYSAEADSAAFEAAQPAAKKLSMIKELEDMIAMKKRHEILLNGGLLGALKSWLEPLTDRKTHRMVLPHVKVRAAVLRALSRLPLDTHHQESRDRLKMSGIGPVLVFYSKCSKETVANQRAANDLVQGWIMPIVEEGRNDMKDQAVAAQKRAEQKRSLKTKRMKEKAEENAEAERRTKQQEGLTVGNPGYRYHARVPAQARLDYVEMPTVPQSVAQRLAEKVEREGGTRALIKKQVLKIDRINRGSGKQRSSTVKISGRQHD